MKNKFLLAIASATLAVTVAAVAVAANSTNEPTQVDAAVQADRIALGTGTNLSTYKGYSRYEGYKFATNSTEVTVSATSALVLNFRNYSAKTAFAFYLNGTLNSGSSSVKKQAYTYKNSGAYIATVDHGAFSVGYYNNAFSYIAIPLSNFSVASVGTTLTITNFTITIRLNGVASSNLSYSSADADLFGAYLSDDFTGGEALNVAGLTRIYTPSSASFEAFDSGNTGITGNCITAEFVSEKAYLNEAKAYASSAYAALGAVCDAAGATSGENLKTAWNNNKTSYEELSDGAKAMLANNDQDDDPTMKAFFDRYDFVYSKYAASLSLEDYAGRSPSMSSGALFVLNTNDNTIATTIVVSSIAIASLGLMAIIGKKKHN